MSKKNAKGIVEAVENVSKVLGTSDPTTKEASVMSQLTSDAETAKTVEVVKQQDAEPTKTSANYVAKAAAKLKKRIETGELKPVAVPAPPSEEEKAKIAAEKAAAKAAEKAAKEAEKAAIAAQKEKEKIPQLSPVLLAQTFPAEIHHEHFGKLVRNDEIETLAQFRAAYESGKRLLLAFWWSRRHLKQFDYDARLAAPRNGFPNDLDIAQPVYISDSNSVMYAVSHYTSRLYDLYPSTLALSDDFLRFLNGCEFTIYEITEAPTANEPKPAEKVKAEAK